MSSQKHKQAVPFTALGLAMGKGASKAACAILIVSLAAMLVTSPAYAWRLEAGRITTNNTSTTPSFNVITFQSAFDTTPIVVALTSDEGGDPSALRIRNVTTTGFEIAALEPTGNDGAHAAMTIDYIAMEPGVHLLPDGEIVVAGFHTTSTVQRSDVVGGPSGWDTVSFGETLSDDAAVVASIQTMNGETGNPPSMPSIPWLTMAVRNPSTTNVEMALERSEVAAGTVVAQTIGYIAFPQDMSGSFNDIGGIETDWSAVTTDDAIVGRSNGCTNHTFSTSAFGSARVVATKNTRDGVDGGWLRRCNLTTTQIGLFVDEDIANDSERGHTDESAGMLAFSRSFHAVFEGLLTAVKTLSLEEDPVNGTSNTYTIPGARIRYNVVIESVGGTAIDNNSVDFIDILPPETRFVVNDIDGAGSGPVRFIDGTTTSELTYNFVSLGSTSDDIDFSNNGGISFNYTPTPDADGADDDITHIRIRPKGKFVSSPSLATPSFEIEYDVLVD